MKEKLTWIRRLKLYSYQQREESERDFQQCHWFRILFGTTYELGVVLINKDEPTQMSLTVAWIEKRVAMIFSWEIGYHQNDTPPSNREQPHHQQQTLILSCPPMLVPSNAAVSEIFPWLLRHPSNQACVPAVYWISLPLGSDVRFAPPPAGDD